MKNVEVDPKKGFSNFPSISSVKKKSKNSPKKKQLLGKEKS
jgi:hypothetical protein